MKENQSIAVKTVTAFVCANCSHAGQPSNPADRSRQAVPGFDWPFSVHEVPVACTGRLQPEHVLKAFESGADLVFTVSCDTDDCRYLQGNERWARRAGFVRTVLDEIGLGGRRLMLFSLPGTAAGPSEAQVAAICETVSRTLDDVAPNPLCLEPTAGTAEELYQQVDVSGEADED